VEYAPGFEVRDESFDFIADFFDAFVELRLILVTGLVFFRRA
jgi:hypothetical protein